MKRFLYSGLLIASLAAGGIEKGDLRTTVLSELGEPSGSIQNNGKEILLYKTGTVTLQNDAVTEIDLSQNYVKQAEEREKQAEVFRIAKKAELEKHKILYPEDRVIQIPCTYSKTENCDFLPDSIRPAHGNYTYDVYIPKDYHESDRYYSCIVLESPAFWDSVKERARNEKWIVVILHDTSGEQIGRRMNGNFIAAFDDATKRFRISKEHIFNAGRVPSAIFAMLRPVAGIILQEPDFKGFLKINFDPDFMRKNPSLRAYVLLGNEDRGNVRYQGQFIVDHIPKYRIDVYPGATLILPQALADKAIDWMKTEYRIP